MVDNTTLMNSLYLLGNKMANNLNAMGVTGFTYDDGLNTLADQILNIPLGIEVVTSLSCTSNKSAVMSNEEVTISGVLKVDKDDTTQTNIDLEGYLKGATIKIYDGETLLGTTITDSDGKYNFNYNRNKGPLNIYAKFEGTDDYDACQSSIVTISVIPILTLTANKNILSHEDSDVSILTVEFSDDSTGNTVELYNADTDALIGVMTDEEDGTYTYNYQSQGAGNISFYAKCDNLLTKTYSILDTKVYFDNSKISTWSKTSVSGGTVYKSSYSLSDGETAYFKLANVPSGCTLGLFDGDSYFRIMQDPNKIRVYGTGLNEASYSYTLTADDVIKFERVSSTEQKLYINDTLFYTASNHSLNSPKPMIEKYSYGVGPNYNYNYNMDYIYVL